MRKQHAQQSRRKATRLRKIRLARRARSLEVMAELDSLQTQHGRLPVAQVLKVGLRNRCRATVRLAMAA